MRLTECFVILGHFLTFHPPSDPENQNFEKMKKMYGDIILLQMCTINEDHMTNGPEIYDVTDIFFCHFGSFFALSPPHNLENQDFETMKKNTWRYYHYPPRKRPEKSKFYNNEKTPGDIIILHMRTKNYDHRRYSF